MKKLIIKIIAFLTTRRSLWRFGRALYLTARADVNNELNTNGERNVQYSVLKKFINSNEEIIIFDIGANIGDWTFSTLDIAASLGVDKQLEIHLFEPVLSTFRTLESRIIGSKRFKSKIHLINQGHSSDVGTADIFIVGENAGTNSLHPDPLHPSTKLQKIELTTGDSYCTRAGIDKVHFIKCDAEGHDVNVLYGIKNLMELEKVMVFQFEYTHFWVYSRHFLKDVFDFISNSHYRIGKITPNRIELYEKWHPELEKFFAGNYLIIHESALEWFNLSVGEFDVFDTYGT